MDLECIYIEDTWMGFPKKFYACQITSASITDIRDRTIRSIVGIHERRRNNFDVEAIYFGDTTVKFFPQDLHEIFPCLKVIWIDNCGLKEITRSDLNGLENLETLNLEHNQLTTLPSNLFEDMKKLKRVVFDDNNLGYVSSKLLEPILKNPLRLVDFSRNKNIDAFHEPRNHKSFTMEKLMEEIDRNCKAPKEEKEKEDKEDHKTIISRGFEKFWYSEELSDFSIFVGSKEFKVHKIVLCIHSAIMTERFESQFKYYHQLDITDFSVEVVSDILCYLYTGKLPNPENAMDAFVLSSKLGFNKLKVICEQIICKNVLSNKNAYNVYMLGHIYDSDKIKCTAFKRIKSMFPDADISDNLMYDPGNLKALMTYKNGFDDLLKVFSRL